MGTVTKGFDARLANRPVFSFWISGILALTIERQSARKSKTKNGSVSQPGVESLDLATPEGCKAELTYVTWKRIGWELNPRPVCQSQVQRSIAAPTRKTLCKLVRPFRRRDNQTIFSPPCIGRIPAYSEVNKNIILPIVLLTALVYS